MSPSHYHYDFSFIIYLIVLFIILFILDYKVKVVWILTHQNVHFIDLPYFSSKRWHFVPGIHLLILNAIFMTCSLNRISLGECIDLQILSIKISPILSYQIIIKGLFSRTKPSVSCTFPRSSRSLAQICLFSRIRARWVKHFIWIVLLCHSN